MQKQTLAELPTPSISRKYICLPFESDEQYSKCVDNHRLFRIYLDRQIAARPELFPEAVSAGYNIRLENAQVLLTGAILAIRKRTVTTCLRIMGESDDPHSQNYHTVLNYAQWSALTLIREPLVIKFDIL